MTEFALRGLLFVLETWAYFKAFRDVAISVTHMSARTIRVNLKSYLFAFW